MDGHTNFNTTTTNEIHCSSSSSSSLPSSWAIPFNEYDSLYALKSEFRCSSSSRCSSSTNNNCKYYGSPTLLANCDANNCGSSLMQRSISSHSLLNNNNVEGFSTFVSSPAGYYVSESNPVRKVFSTGDLEGMNPKLHSHQSHISLAEEYSIIESMSKACRYSPEEKKERIERYRIKRNLRNFNRKIKYECRKTLADSRPRIRGRFARNDEIEKNFQYQRNHAGIQEDEDNDNWIHFLDTFSASMIP